MNRLPDFLSADTLRQHLRQTMAFYDLHCLDPEGGFYHYFLDNGTVYDSEQRHLVSSTRFIFNYAMASRHLQRPDYLKQLQHGLHFLRTAHRNQESGGYSWTLRWKNGRRQLIDDDNYSYGLAFVALAYAHALMAGVSEARTWLDETIAIMNRQFWQAQYQLFADQASADWSCLRSYRGQNANMHACEALLAAYDATGNIACLHQAEQLAVSVCQRLASQGGGMIWEHYDQHWQIDLAYHQGDSSDIFRPWGYQPGHFSEWAKLLLILERHAAHLAGDAAWLADTAKNLFDCAMAYGWDSEHQGIYYAFAPDLSVCDEHKYFWVQAESLAAAALLARRTGLETYWNWYRRIWQYCWQHMIDHRYGGWFRILDRHNRQLSNQKSPAGKTDYHTMGACYEVLNSLNGGPFAN